VPDRANVDTYRNRFGKLLVDFCIINSLLIVNGRLGTDKGIGDCTYVSSNGCSTIDYYIVSRALFDNVKDFRIDNNGLYDNLPIILFLKTVL
jgi:hypothetical protein